MLLLTLRGTPTVYYGDELGLPDVPISRDQERDPFGLKEPGQSRDPQRTPMRWDATPTAGFTTSEPWLPIGPRVAELNVETERSDPHSVLNLHRLLLDLRKRESALSVGDYRSVGVEGSVMAYERSAGSNRFLVVLNLGHGPAPIPAAARDFFGRIEVSTYLDQDGMGFAGNGALRSDEGIVVRLHGLTRAQA
jgi:alpha-glucosidase